MDPSPADLLHRVLDLAAGRLDASRIADAKRRHADMFRWEESDYVPIVFGGPVPEVDGLPDFDWAQQFADPAASLYMQMKDVLRGSAGGSDFVPSVRADTGVVNGPSVLGAPFVVPAHTKPVCCGHVGREALADFVVPDDIRPLGAIPTMVEHSQHHVAALKAAGLYERVGLRHCDTQGPFDIAAQARGHDDIFVDMYVDQDFFHGLMEKATDVYVKLSKLSKALAGDGAMDQGHASEFWMENGSVRLCDDSGILVGPDQYGKLCAPYLARAFAPFGGGWLHYCGGEPGASRPEGLHLHEIYGAVPGLKGLQFTTARDWAGEIRKVIEKGIVYLNTLPRDNGEKLADYFRRLLSLCDGRRGMIPRAGRIEPDERAGAMETWWAVQDEMFG